MTTHDLKVDLIDALKSVQSKTIVQGSTLCVFETNLSLWWSKFSENYKTVISKTTKVVYQK